ncbi:hypothetical protein VHEMI06334 [[Torrubiella] hemipterigena]|uniref:Uncharacterized protein n=1 Tax=[Torrubiella] hemipterigena TaxID=1531966 RepID=A0A0A1TJ54_9HYPO|nr:hypothetical protein VHEMI06334 [[Torrubiella] hemipterigena]
MAETSMSYLYTLGGYATLFGVGYAVYHVSSQQQARKRSLARGAKGSQQEAPKEDSKKKQRMAAFAQEAHETASKPSAPAPEPQIASSSADKDSMDDSRATREFALQLAKAKEGTKFDKKSENKQQKEKSVKQSKASQLAAPKTPAQPTDDEPIAGSEPEEISPDVPEDAQGNIPAEAGRVDDMLEAKPAGPSVLRLTSTAPKEEKKKTAKAPEKVETKKQRQNRRKAEAAKAMAAEAEAHRKVLEEKQRRTARIADGRAAKDGSQFTNAAVSAWKQGSPNGHSAPTNGFHTPLDTSELVDAPAAAVPVAVKTTPKSAAKPVEPVVVQQQDNDDEWNTVQTKSSKKKAAVPLEAVAEATKPVPAPVAARAPTVAKKVNFGAFSALTNDDDEEEEEEEEWDV